MLVFDIETGPLADEELRKVYTEPELPEHPGEFDESQVKLGNTKDQNKILLKIEEARNKHGRQLAEHDSKCQSILSKHWEDFKGKAALDALTGRILAIGYFNPDNDKHIVDSGEELQLLENFWRQYESKVSDRRSIVGHNILNFDLPFICRRSWLLGITIPGRS